MSFVFLQCIYVNLLNAVLEHFCSYLILEQWRLRNDFIFRLHYSLHVVHLHGRNCLFKGRAGGRGLTTRTLVRPKILLFVLKFLQFKSFDQDQ